jgi:hypothetical protein
MAGRPRQAKEVLLETKPGCFVGVSAFSEELRERVVYFGRMDSKPRVVEGETMEVELTRFVERYNYRGQTSDVKTTPKKFTVHSSDILLGESLLENLGGDKVADRLLDQLDHKFDPIKHETFVQSVKQEKMEALQQHLESKKEAKQREREERRKEAQAEKERIRKMKETGMYYGPLDRTRDVVKDALKTAPIAIAAGVAAGVKEGALLTARYFHGYFPWAYQKTNHLWDASSVMNRVWRGDAWKDSARTFGLNVAGMVAYQGIRIINGEGLGATPEQLTYTVLPAVNIVGEGAMRVKRGIDGIREEIKAEQQKILRLERLRQAQCSLNGERFYDVNLSMFDRLKVRLYSKVK